MGFFGHRQGDIERHRGFAHAGAGCNQHKVRFVETVDLPVQILQARGKARYFAARLGQFLSSDGVPDFLCIYNYYWMELLW